MNKKVIALAVAGAFAAPTAAFAQVSNVQIYGTVYMEYGYFKQGAQSPIGSGDLVNIDVLQSPGSEIGLKGEEALGGGTSAWFQCASTADIRGVGTGAGGQGFCGRNSAIGVKGSFGNAYVGNWDLPMKKTAGAVRIVSDTGLWGVGPMLFGNSTTTNGRASATTWSRRQNASIFYDSPVFSGFQVLAGVSTPLADTLATTNLSGAKARVWGLAANYSNGPLLLTAGYENHSNFNPAANGAAAGFAGNDQGYQLGAKYEFGPVRAGLLYTKQKYEMSAIASADVSAWNLAAEWNIAGPHALRGGYTKANNTGGSFAGGLVGTGGGARVYNAGVGSTGGTIWQVQYVYNASKRTEMTVGYARLQNDANARYALGGITNPAAGQNQDAFGVSMKNTF